jgi:hypothetical protein
MYWWLSLLSVICQIYCYYQTYCGEKKQPCGRCLETLISEWFMGLEPTLVMLGLWSESLCQPGPITGWHVVL